jgi:C-terminal processing protease CtpA/Prc
LSAIVVMMDEVHPNLYHDISKEALKTKVDSIISTVRDSMTRKEAWSKFAAVTGAIDEGHTSLSWPQEFSSPAAAYFPVFLKAFDGRGFIVRLDASAEHAFLEGDRIVSINGRSAKELLQQFTPFVGGLPEWKELMVAIQLRLYLNISGMRSPFTVEYFRDGDRHTAVVTEQKSAELTEKVREFRKLNPSVNYSYVVTNDRIGYLNFRSMNNYERFSSFIDSVFTTIENEKVDGLIVDLRQNSGGNSELGDKLLEYITTKKYRMAAGIKWKISQTYKDFYNSLPEDKKFLKGNELEQKYLNGGNQGFIVEESDLRKPAKQKARFSGKVCFLIGPNTFSSANMLANAIKDYQLATLIGSPTGECPNDFGELITLKTPNLGMEFSTSTKQYIRANGDASNREPILPDHFVTDDPTTSEDEVMEFAKGWIKAKK